MALCTCKCLNLILESDKAEFNTEFGKLELTPMEQRDIFFSEEPLVSGGNLKPTISQPALVDQRVVGRWIVNSCLACGQTTHALLQSNPKVVLISKQSLSSREKINSAKKSNNYSPVFNLLVPDVNGDIEMKENINTNNKLVSDKKIWLPAQQVIGTLHKQLNKTLESQLSVVEQTVQQFRDQKYAEFQAYKERAEQDHKTLSRIINKTKKSSESDSWHMDTSLDNGPPSPQLPPQQRRRLSSIKDAKKISRNNFKQADKSVPPEEDSLDAEDIFDFDEVYSRNDMGSDQDDYGSDNSESHDEGIHISRGRTVNDAADIARSLPINVPRFANERPSERELDDDNEPSQDIAASMKALAKSVHGDAFELPRPRFSTQI